VLVEDEGNSARQLLDAATTGPVRSVFVGIVDQVHHESE
jgi:microcompartment protein CcmK/EutM